MEDPAEPLQKLCVGHQRPGLTGGVPGARTGKRTHHKHRSTGTHTDARACTHTHTRTLTHALAGATSPCSPARPPRSRAEFPPLLIVRGPAPAQPPPRPTPLALWASSWGRGRRPARTGRGGSRRSSARAGPQRRRHRPDRSHLRSSLLAPRPSPDLRQAGGTAGTRLRSSRLSPGLPERRRRSSRADERP